MTGYHPPKRRPSACRTEYHSVLHVCPHLAENPKRQTYSLGRTEAGGSSASSAGGTTTGGPAPVSA